MAGLLDMIEDPVSQGLLSFGARMMSTPGSTGQAFGLSTLGAMDDLQKASAIQQQRKRAALYDQQMQMQMEQARQAQARQAEAQARQQAIEEAYRGAIRTPDMQAMQQFGGPTVAAANAAPGMTPQVDQRALIEGLMKADPMAAYQMMQPKPADYKVVGDALVSVGPQGVKEAYRAPPKPEAATSDVRNFEYGQKNPAFNEWALSQKKAGGTTVNVNTEKPLMNSLAQGLGKQIDDSLASAKAALPAIQTSQTLRAAVDSGKLVSGPGASFRVMGLQIGQMLGVGGKDGAEILANTRTAIQSMAQAELDAAQQMKGQGQITESERDIIRRAAAGNINDLTAPEMRLLSEAMEKTARYKIAQHKRNVEGLGRMPGAAPLMQFYQMEDPPAYAAPAAAGGGGVRKFNPKTGKIE
jgi:hypothetical protein